MYYYWWQSLLGWPNHIPWEQGIKRIMTCIPEAYHTNIHNSLLLSHITNYDVRSIDCKCLIAFWWKENTCYYGEFYQTFKQLYEYKHMVKTSK